MPRIAAMCTVAAGTASGSARGWFTHDSTNLRAARHARDRRASSSRPAPGRDDSTADSMLMTRLVDQADHLLERRLGQIRLEVRAARERADAQSVAIVGQYGHAFANMFRRRAIHDGAAARLELPGALAGGDDERVAAQARHRRLERRQRAQRGIEEQQAEDLAGERLRLGLLVARRSASASSSTTCSRCRSARSRKLFMG